jgi:SMC interacting uncharacterized protein involved in chromosome segregation
MRNLFIERLVEKQAKICTEQLENAISERCKIFDKLSAIEKEAEILFKEIEQYQFAKEYFENILKNMKEVKHE